ncbi:MAG: type I 3-dehydroquinate dehydratase [Kiritimatiellia bacterium]
MKTRFGKSPLIVGCIGSEAQLRRCAKRLPLDCDLLEVRLDLTGLCGGHWINHCVAIQRLGMPVLLTLRSDREGGEWKGREAERVALYLAGLKSVSAVDMEIGAHALESLAHTAHRYGVKVVGSFHDFAGTPDLACLQTVETRARRMGVDVVKIATLVKTPADLARLYAVPVQAKGPICVLGMGRLGSVSRVALPCAGSCLAYGALGRETAPGQLTCRQLAKELGRWGARK